LRSGREHLAWILAVEEDDKDDKEDEEEAGGRRRQEEEATDIKSNNPHLAGGEFW